MSSLGARLLPSFHLTSGYPFILIITWKPLDLQSTVARNFFELHKCTLHVGTLTSLWLIGEKCITSKQMSDVEMIVKKSHKDINNRDISSRYHLFYCNHLPHFHLQNSPWLCPSGMEIITSIVHYNFANLICQRESCLDLPRLDLTLSKHNSVLLVMLLCKLCVGIVSCLTAWIMVTESEVKCQALFAIIHATARLNNHTTNNNSVACGDHCNRVEWNLYTFIHTYSIWMFCFAFVQWFF